MGSFQVIHVHRNFYPVEHGEILVAVFENGETRCSLCVEDIETFVICVGEERENVCVTCVVYLVDMSR